MRKPIKRYDVLGDFDGGYLEEAADGRAVKYDDHLAELARLDARIADLERHLSGAIEVQDCLVIERDQLRAMLVAAVKAGGA